METPGSEPRTISMVKEKRRGERRVLLLPREVGQLREAGLRVLVEAGAGAGVGVDDAEYARAGASIVGTEDAWSAGRLVVKYKAPSPDEYKHLRTGLHLGAVFHAEGDRSLIEALCKSRITAYSFEFFRTRDGIFPLSIPASEIAGRLAVIYGTYFLQKHLSGAGVLLGSIPGARPGKVVVIGHGNAGGSAARTAAALGADVVVLGRNRERLLRFQMSVPASVRCHLNSRAVLERELPDTDLLIGAILISTYDTPAMVDESLVKKMKRGSMIIDLTCGYGPGYLATFDRSTSLQEPVFERFGVLHCKTDAFTSAVHTTAVQALSPLIAPYLIDLARSVYDPGASDPTSAAGMIVDGGRAVHPEIVRHLELYKAMAGQQAGGG